MAEAPVIRKKAWERADEPGLIAKVAVAEGVRPQTARRWFLQPGHPDRRAVQSERTQARLHRLFDLEPNDFVWLYGERAQRRRLQQIKRAA